VRDKIFALVSDEINLRIEYNMSYCEELINPASSTDKTYIDCTIREKTLENKIYTRCVFRDVNFDNCLFNNVRFIECEFSNVSFDNCKSSSMIFNKTEFHNSLIRKSKFNLTVISKTNFTNFRFYNSIFLETNFEDCNITETILENSSFVKTSMIYVILVAVRIFSNDFRNSSFQELYFESDVEIQRSNFNNCKFDDSHFGTPRIMTSIFDDSHFISVSYTDNSKIKNCSLENITYENTNIIAPSVPEIRNRIEWLPVVLNISESVVSEQPSIIGRGYNMYIPEPYMRGRSTTRSVPASVPIPSVPIPSVPIPSVPIPGVPIPGVPIPDGPFSRGPFSRGPETALLVEFISGRISQTEMMEEMRLQGIPITNGLERMITSAEQQRQRERERQQRELVERERERQQRELVERERRQELEAAQRKHEVLTQEHLQNNKNKIFGIIDKDVQAGQTAYEVIEGEVSLTEHLKENKDTIAFLFQQDYYISTRENITRMISHTTKIDKENNSIVYECIRTDTMRPENILLVNPLVKVASLGIAINGAYMPSTELSMILTDKRSDIKYRIYEIIDTGKVTNSVVSYQVMNHLTNYVGSSHCQKGQGGRIYKIRKIRNVNNILSNFVSKYKTNKNKKNVGGFAEQNNRTAKTKKCVKKRTNKSKKAKSRRNKSNKKRKNKK
jgi:uncharacterized protein YjbI with pentapeptide repeats